ncbi:MAG: hypothetical protein PHD68_07195 [Rugosibacter sp.]|nr:hypothetical protein [Rugosibacter sp.]
MALEQREAALLFPGKKETYMLNRKNFGVTAYLLAGAILFIAAPVFIPTNTQAATANTAAPTIPSIPPAPTSKFPPRRAPLAPPAINDVSRAYEFRTQLLGSPQCQRFATESDNVFLNGTLDDAQKADKLKALGAEAKASDCLAPAATY